MNMENNITAVQFIKEQIELHSDTSFFNIDWDRFDEVIKKAKAMEKEQMNNAYNDDRPNLTEYTSNEAFELYYNETFKSE